MVAQSLYVNTVAPADGALAAGSQTRRRKPGCLLQPSSTGQLLEGNPASPVDAAVGAGTQLVTKCQNYRTSQGCFSQLSSPPKLSQDNENPVQTEVENTSCGSTISSAEQPSSVKSDSFGNYCDDDSDGELVIIDDNDKYISLDKPAGDEDTTSGSSTSDKIEMPTVIQEEEQSEDHVTSPRNGSRNETQQKMEHGKLWLSRSLIFINTTLSVVALSSIEEAYQKHCKETGKEALTTPVLARLIHSLFSDAIKCRLGPRGNQKIHYRKLQLKQTTVSFSQSTINTSENSTASVNSVNDSVDPTSDEIFNIYKQEERQPEDSGKQEHKNIKDKESVDEPEVRTNHVAVTEKDEKKEEKTGISETPSRENQMSQISMDDKEGCEIAAERLSKVLKWISNQGRKDVLLQVFAHSASCQLPSCTPVCLMFRRVRRHVVAARHSCSVLRVYSTLLRMHVSSCKSSDCGLPACPALRATKPVKRSIEQQENPSKRPAVSSGGVRFPSTLALAPRSPPSSLPGSPVNSPPLSPEVLSQGGEPHWQTHTPVQYVIVPVMPVIMPLPENRGA
ncbi:uncharacterized protein LOC121856237 isoform X2 [Homarus americanus]|uniref:uncharacterized protein LOC121856237 isoform X2 n=1 Tax=Homarus americanus TaxID=6706 RepID=UPI001C4669EB|nr:uncharacterized protein LOC121856237 isoform X2 [Homarus americanus]